MVPAVAIVKDEGVAKHLAASFKEKSLNGIDVMTGREAVD